ncbi:MAG TPA: hypothetical protein VK730_07830 [Solirubrobacteraceae bacterium]|nr:hypothetical protein [Solirubrobacteraceae bacterium]
MLIRLIVVALLGAATALLVSCGSSGAGLIPSASAGPLQEDFEAVAKAAEAGNGDCAKTEAALGKTEEDFLALPATVDKGLHKRLEEGITNLRKQALAMCEEPTATDTSTTSTQTKSTPQTGTTNTETTTSTETATTPTTPTNTPTTPTTGTPPSPGGGVEAPEEGSGENGVGLGASKESAGNGTSNSGGASAGGGQ